MYLKKTFHAQQENVDQGTLQISVRSQTDNHPVENALVRISYTGDPDSVIERSTDRFLWQYSRPAVKNTTT